jgi:transcription elongation factor Elf1
MSEEEKFYCFRCNERFYVEIESVQRNNKYKNYNATATCPKCGGVLHKFIKRSLAYRVLENGKM